MVKVDWSKLSEDANYVAMDDNGEWYWYNKKPTYSQNGGKWINPWAGDYGEIAPPILYDYSCINPKDSLISKEQTVPKPHRHAELIKQWADDPNLKFEWRKNGIDNWKVVDKPAWNENAEYRIKPKEQEYIIINGVKVPKPETEKPKIGQLYCVPYFGQIDFHVLLWCDDEWENEYLQNGMVHLNSCAAALHKHAIVKANKGE